MQEKSVPDWISCDRSQGEGQGNPGVHLGALSLPPPGSSESIKMKTCDFMPQERWRSRHAVNIFNTRTFERGVRGRMVSNQNTVQET